MGATAGNCSRGERVVTPNAGDSLCCPIESVCDPLLRRSSTNATRELSSWSSTRLPLFSTLSPGTVFRELLLYVLVSTLLVLPLGFNWAADSPKQNLVDSLPEYVLKAGFLFNFAKYVDWPSDSFEHADSPISIGIVGKDPFGNNLEKALNGKAVKGRGFIIRRYREPADIQRCHILFVPRSANYRLSDILTKIANWPVVTVGEEGGFCQDGGTIGILIEDDKSKLEVNIAAAAKARVTIHSKLLRIAIVVKPVK